MISQIQKLMLKNQVVHTQYSIIQQNIQNNDEDFLFYLNAKLEELIEYYEKSENKQDFIVQDDSVLYPYNLLTCKQISSLAQILLGQLQNNQFYIYNDNQIIEFINNIPDVIIASDNYKAVIVKQLCLMDFMTEKIFYIIYDYYKKLDDIVQQLIFPVDQINDDKVYQILQYLELILFILKNMQYSDLDIYKQCLYQDSLQQNKLILYFYMIYDGLISKLFKLQNITDKQKQVIFKYLCLYQQIVQCIKYENENQIQKQQYYQQLSLIMKQQMNAVHQLQYHDQQFKQQLVQKQSEITCVYLQSSNQLLVEKQIDRVSLSQFSDDQQRNFLLQMNVGHLQFLFNVLNMYFLGPYNYNYQILQLLKFVFEETDYFQQQFYKLVTTQLNVGEGMKFLISAQDTQMSIYVQAVLKYILNNCNEHYFETVLDCLEIQKFISTNSQQVKELYVKEYNQNQPYDQFLNTKNEDI